MVSKPIFKKLKEGRQATMGYKVQEAFNKIKEHLSHLSSIPFILYLVTMTTTMGAMLAQKI